jgi:hypothetical protein
MELLGSERHKPSCGLRVPESLQYQKLGLSIPQSRFKLDQEVRKTESLRDFIFISNIGISARVHYLQSAIGNLKSQMSSSP